MADKRASDGVQKTTVASAGAVSVASLLTWIFQMMAAHAWMQPSPELTMIMGGAIAPLLHAAHNRLMRRVDPTYSPEPT